jgi:hypothetical protein
VPSKKSTRTKASACGKKTPYRTSQAAEKARKGVIRRTGASPADVKVYKCPFCKHWHTGRGWGTHFRQTRNRPS